MDPRIRLLVDGVRRTHYPIYRVLDPKTLKMVDGFCRGCKGMVVECPVLAAADELEKEYAEG